MKLKNYKSLELPYQFRYLNIDLKNRTAKEKHTTLNIIRISFDDKLKSDFYFKGNKISVKISDPDFQKRIDNGESFAKGDILEVELEIKQKFSHRRRALDRLLGELSGDGQEL